MSTLQGCTVLVDGYNVIKRHAAWKSLALRDARHRLVAHLERLRWPIPVSRILVIFDSRNAPNDFAQTVQGTAKIQVYFATPSADAHMIDWIRAHPANLLVISDDEEILQTAKSHGVRRYPTRWLVQRSQNRTQPTHPLSHARDQALDNTTLPAATARRITEELAKRWLPSNSG